MYKIKPQGESKHFDFIILDIISINIAFVLAYITRMGLANPYKQESYLNIALVYTLVDVVTLVYGNVLKGVLKRGYYIEIAQTIKHALMIELVVAFFMFSSKTSATYSRIVIYLIPVYYIVVAYLLRIIWKKQLLSRKSTASISSMFVITTNDRADRVINKLQNHNHGAYQFLGLCITDKECKGQTVSDVAVTANLDDVTEYLCREWVDEIFVSLPATAHYLTTLVSDLTDMGIIVHQEIIDVDDVNSNFRTVEKIAGSTVLTTGINAATYKQAAIKRTIDILAGLAGCLATLLLTVIIGPIIYIKSPGPIFFSQTRIGKNGKKFKMYKFRSMYLDAEERKAELMKENRVKDGMMFKLDFDPRIIGAKKLPDGTIKKGIGNYIRDWSLDEFPQFLNVLTGDMSLVGTRPPTEDEWNKYELHHRARLAFKPGITGMWQVSGRSNITDFEEVVKLDRKYIQNWSMGLDFRILLQTVKVVLGKEGSM